MPLLAKESSFYIYVGTVSVSLPLDLNKTDAEYDCLAQQIETAVHSGVQAALNPLMEQNPGMVFRIRT